MGNRLEGQALCLEGEPGLWLPVELQLPPVEPASGPGLLCLAPLLLSHFSGGMVTLRGIPILG